MTTIPTEFDEGKLVALFGPLRLALTRGREGRELEELHILLAGTGGEVGEALQTHILEHFRQDQIPSGTCPFCKLQGRILAAEGRRRLSEREVARAKITLVPRGVTGEAIMAAEERALERARERARRLPRLNKGAGDVWF